MLRCKCEMSDNQRQTRKRGMKMNANATETTICGKRIQHDNSGVGHNWRNIDASDIPHDVIDEIEGEMIDGKRTTCSDFVGSNGLHYRW